jgi:hypothetical protein
VPFKRGRVKDPLNWSFGYHKIPEASSFKYLAIITQRDVSWVDLVNYAVKKWKALHFIMRVLKKGKSNTKSLAYALVLLPSCMLESIRGSSANFVRLGAK